MWIRTAWCWMYGPSKGCFAIGPSATAPLCLADRLGLLAQVGERQAQVDVGLSVSGPPATCAAKCLSRHLGVLAGLRLVPTQRPRLRQDEPPGSAVAVERPRRQAQQQVALRVVEHPVEVVASGEVDHERRRLHLFRRRGQHRPCPREVPLLEKGHRLQVDQVEVRRGEGEATVERLARLAGAAQPKESGPEHHLGLPRAGVQLPRPTHVRERLLPPPQASLDEAHSPEEARVVGGEPQPAR